MADTLVQLLRARLGNVLEQRRTLFADHLDTVVACTLPDDNPDPEVPPETAEEKKARFADRNRYMATWNWTEYADSPMPFGHLHHGSAGEWYDELPDPLTAGVALDLVADRLDHMAAVLARNIEAAARVLVAPEYLAAVLAQGDLLAGEWPWPYFDGGPEWFALYAASFEPLVKTPPEGPGQPGTWTVRPPDRWHAGAKPIDVTRWAQAPLDQLDPDLNIGTDLCESTTQRGLPGEVSWSHDDGFRVVLPPKGLALLWLAWDAIRLGVPAAPQVALVDVGTSTVRLVTSLAGADPRDLSPGANLYPNAAQPTKVMFEWADGDQLQLDFVPGMNPLVRIGQKYGAAAVRDLLAMYLFHRAAGVPAGGSLWWWPEEHLDLVGVNPKDKENRRRLRDWRDLMRNTRVKFHYATGRPLSGPVLEGDATDGAAYRVAFHPALYQGVTQESGALGNYWWPVSVKLLRLPADLTEGKVHVLSVILGQQWRAELGKTPEGEAPVARIDVARLADKLAILPQSDRKKQTRAADTLRTTMEAGKQGGLVGDYWVERGSLDHRTGVLYATPGDDALRIRREGPPPSAWLPATGGDVTFWLARGGLNSKEAGERLGLPASTIRRVCSTHQNRPLPIKVRNAFRRLLWPMPE